MGEMDRKVARDVRGRITSGQTGITQVLSAKKRPRLPPASGMRHANDSFVRHCVSISHYAGFPWHPDFAPTISDSVNPTLTPLPSMTGQNAVVVRCNDPRESDSATVVRFQLAFRGLDLRVHRQKVYVPLTEL